MAVVDKSAPVARQVRESPTRIGIAVVARNRQFLVGTRGSGQSLFGAAEFPGGKCDPHESFAECAGRECFEETGIAVEAVELLDSRVFQYDHGSVDLQFWLCRPVGPSEATKPKCPFRWLPIEELGQLPFPAANDSVITLLKRRF